MSESKPKSKPIPEAEQTVDQYIKEELSKEEDGEPKYPGLTIEKIIADPEYEDVRTHPNFRAMLERSNAVDLLKMLDDKMGTADESTSKPKATEEKAEDPKPSPVPAAPVLDVVEPLDPVDSEVEAKMSTPVEKGAPSSFEPKYKREEVEITNQVEYEAVGPFLLAKGSGLGSMLNVPSHYDLKKKADRALVSFLLTFVTPGLIKPLSPSVDGYENVSNHNFMSGNPIQDLPLKRLEVEADVVTLEPPRELLMNPENLSRFIGGMADVDGERVEIKDNRAISLSLYPFSENPVLIHKIRVNPYKLVLALPKLRAHKYLFRDGAAFLAGNVFRGLNPNIYASLRKETTQNLDVINDTKAEVALFTLADIDRNRFYYDSADSMTTRLYSELSDRSMQKASSYFAHINAPFKMLDVSVVRVGASTVSQFNRILSSDGAVMMKLLGSFICGGRKMVLTVNTQTAIADESPMLRPLAAMANLLLLDSTLLSQDTVLALVTAVFLPFFGLHASRVIGGDDVNRRSGAISIAREILENPNRGQRARQDFARQLEGDFSTVIGGPRGRRGAGNVIREICETLVEVVHEALRRRYELLQTGERVFDYGRGGNDLTPLTPFYMDKNIQDAVLLGTSPYYTDAHLPECRAIHNNLLHYAEALSKIQEIGNIMPILRVAFDEAKHMARSNALVVRSQLECVAGEEDILPFVRREEIPLEYVELPYLGALSYVIFGISSSEEVESGSPFLQYKPRTSIPMPSIFGSYLYLEKAICNSVFAAFSAPNLQYHLKKQERLVQLSLDILGRYFESVDPKSEARITELFANWDRYLSNANGPIHLERVPAELRNLAVNMMVPLLGEKDTPFGRLLLNEDVRPIEIPAVLDHAMNLPDRLIDEVFITVEPIGSVTYVNNLMQRVAIYTLNERPANFVELDDLLQETQFIYSQKLSVQTIRKLALQAGYIAVRISDLRTTFSFKEQVGYADVVIMDGESTIERRLEQNEFKYSMTEVPVYYKPQNDELAVDENGERGPGTLNETFSTYVGITYKAVEQYLVNYDGILPSDPQLMQPGTNLRLKDGSGFVHSVPLNIAHRDSEAIFFKDSLEMRKTF